MRQCCCSARQLNGQILDCLLSLKEEEAVNDARSSGITPEDMDEDFGSADTPGDAKGVAVDMERQLAAVADGTSGLQIIDISDATMPAILRDVTTGDARDVVLSGTFAFVADFSSSFTPVDLTDPMNPQRRTSTPQTTGGLLMDVALADTLAFGADVFFVNGVPIIDVSLPATPAPRAMLDFSAFRDDNGTGIAVDGAYVYLTAALGDIVENGSQGSTRLYIGQYLARDDTAGIAPTASITAPTAGETVVTGTRLPIAVDADDDVAVVAVQFLADDAVIFTDTTPPFQFSYLVPTGGSQLTLGAIAIDPGGNRGEAETVVVTVMPDPLTTVVGRVTDMDGNGVAGIQVATLGRLALAQADGQFTIPEVPTVAGNVVVMVQGEIDGQLALAQSAPVAPVVGGTTDVGTLQLRFLRGALYPTPVFPAGSGTDLRAIAMADLNADSILDLVTANGVNTTDISVLLGNDDGTFQAQQRFDAGQFPVAVAIADLNADGVPDLAVANDGSDDLSILLGNGDGTFQAEQRLDVVILQRQTIAAMDVDNNGAADLLILDRFSGDIFVLLGLGNGTFQAELRVPTRGTSPRALALADLNADNAIDLVTANNSDDVSVLLGNGDGTFQIAQRFTTGNAIAVAAADFNGDTVLDLVTANAPFFQFGNDISVLLGNGDGTFQDEHRIQLASRGPQAVAAADFNGDSVLDLMTVNQFSEDISILLGNGDGSFQAEARFPAPNVRGSLIQYLRQFGFWTIFVKNTFLKVQ